MKIKKFLKKVAEEDRESIINDKDIEFLASIGVDYNKKTAAVQNDPPASYYLTASAVNHKALIGCIACFIVAALTVSLILYFCLKPAPIHYFTDNFVETDADLDKLNAELELFTLVVNENDYELKIKKTYDSVSSDSLFYSLNFSHQNGMKLFTLEIVVNSLYEHEPLSYDDEPVGTQIADYTLKYSENLKTIPGTPLSKVTVNGEMQVGDQWIYVVKYEETALGQSTFIETLQSIISFN